MRDRGIIEEGGPNTAEDVSSLQETIEAAKSFVDDYREGRITRDRFKICIKAVYRVSTAAHLLPLYPQAEMVELSKILKEAEELLQKR